MKNTMYSFMFLLLFATSFTYKIVPSTREQTPIVPEEITSRTESTSPSSAESTYYNRTATYGYAHRWWNDRNPNYPDYSSHGGDCANFVSQCLIAGGLSLHEGTNGEGFGMYPDKDRPSECSNGTIPFCDFLHLHLAHYQPIEYVNKTTATAIPEWVSIGDVAIFGSHSDPWQHAMIVVCQRNKYVGLAAHSYNKWNYSLQKEMNYFPLVHFYHIKNKNLQSEPFCFEVTVSKLNVRVGPGRKGETYYTDIGDIRKGERYVGFQSLTDEQGNRWFHFWYDGRPAWIAAKVNADTYASLVTNPVPRITLDIETYAAVRSGPRSTDPKLGESYAGTLLYPVKCYSNTIQFYWRGQKAWSNRAFFDIADPIKPSIAIQTPKNGTAISSKSITIHWSGQDNLGISQYRLQVDGNKWLNMKKNTSYQRKVSSGSHRVQIKAIDVAENEETVSIYFTSSSEPLGMDQWKKIGILGGIVGISLIGCIIIIFKERNGEKESMSLL